MNPTDRQKAAERQEERRHSFDSAAAAYDLYRQGYPEELFDSLMAQIPSPARVIEIASGSGQATLPLARRGYQIHCIELGARLAAIAQEKLSSYREVTIEVARFEDAQVLPDSADLVVCASAFHWLHHARAIPKIATALRPAGLLALLWTSPPSQPSPPSGTRDPYGAAARPTYLRLAPELLEERARESAPARMSRAVPGVVLGSPLFTGCTQQEMRFTRTLSTAQFLGLLGTYSNYLTLGEAVRAELFSELGKLIERDFGGKLNREFRSVLQLARRRDKALEQI